jgi:hypothetical protein
VPQQRRPGKDPDSFEGVAVHAERADSNEYGVDLDRPIGRLTEEFGGAARTLYRTSCIYLVAPQPTK